MVLPRNIRDIPSGRNVARSFPWWSQGTWVPTAIGEQGRFTTQPTAKSFKNELAAPIEIHELRFLNFIAEEDKELGSIDYTDLSPYVRVQLNSSKDNLIEQWIPVRCLGNRPHDVMSRPKMGTRVTIPAPYFLQFAARFRLDLRLAPDMWHIGNVNEVLEDVYLDVSIRGYDPDNQTPVVLSKQVQLPDNLDDTTPVSFDEEMDTALRHCMIDDISFGFLDPVFDNRLGPGGPPLHLDVRFHPNTGPEWIESNSGWIRLAGVNDPAPMYWMDTDDDRIYFPYTVHRPEAPIVLQPKDELNVLIRREAGVDIPDSREGIERHYCWVHGVQEVK